MNSTRQKKSGQNVKMTNLNGVIRSNESEDNFRNMSTEEQLLSNNKKNKKKTRIQNKSECVGTNDCTHCLDEREINLVYLAENQLLWSELRGHVLYMYKIGRDQNLGPTIVDRVRYLVDALCSKDTHQLFIRLELLAKEVVRDCLESVERIFLNEIRNTTIAYNYLENIITDCDNFLFAARKMLPMLKNLETHLKKFNICWILLHQNLFRIHYLEDRRCQIRAKKAKLLLLSDMEIPAFTETILKFSQFNEAFGALSKQWDESMMKIQKFRESKQVYKNCQHLLNDTWQNFNVNKKSNKFLQDNRNSQDLISNKKMNIDSKINNKTIQLNQNSNIFENNTTLTKSQAKKARRKMKGDHSRQPSADLMPPPAPPRVTDADCQTHQNCASTQTNNNSEYLDPGEFMPKTIAGESTIREKSKKKLLPPPPASPTPPTSPLKKFAPSMSVDNRDVDALVAFVEGLNINEKNIDIIECENKRRRKKQKKEKQRLKKMQSLLEEDQVAQLIKRSPGVTITMVRSNGNNSPNNNARNIPQPKPPIPTIQQQPQQTPRNIPTTPTSNSNNTNNETKDTVLKNTNNTNGTGGNVVVENSGSRMVTIRRITEANTDEPTVTITLKGPTPDQDQVLYRIINGQANYGHLAENVFNKKPVNNSNNNNIEKPEPSVTPLVQLTKKQKKKMKRNNELSIESVPSVGQNFNYNDTKHDTDMIHVTKSTIMETHNNSTMNDTTKSSKKSKKSCNIELSSNELNSKSNNLVKNKKKNGPNIENIVSSCDNTNSIKTSKPMKQQNSKQKQKIVEVNPVVSKQTGKSKSDVPTKSATTNKPPSMNSESSKKTSKTTPSNPLPKQTTIASRPTTTTNTVPNAKQKPEPKSISKHVEPKPTIINKRVSQSSSNTARTAVSSNQMVRDQKNERVYISNSNTQQHPTQKSVPINTHQMNGTDIYHDTNSNNYKLIPENLRLPAGITITKVPPNCNTRKMAYDTQRKFNTNHLDITPETSRVHFAGTEPQQQQPQRPPRNDLSVDLIIEKQQQLESDFEIRPENRQPPIGTGVPRACDAPAKFIRAPDGRIIIRSPMARSTTPPLNPITMIRQDLEMGVSPPNVPIPPFWSRNDWWLPGTDNVFAPKDIDLEDNSIDAEERELEAFKRFCQEPVPPQRQEVTHLNVQKIIIKKNHPS